MKINRHNYEEYFLLYIDNELTVDQKKQVDLFVSENQDLEEELVMLQQSKLIPDDSILFDNKDQLIKGENDSFINSGNYEEWLVLYIDNELSEEQAIVVEKFAAAHPRVQQELGLFKMTRLQPDNTVFADKEVLYKKERASIISMNWWKVAVAAILIIAASITFYSISTSKTNRQTNTPVATVKNNSKVDSKNVAIPSVKSSVNPSVQIKYEKPAGVEKEDQMAVKNSHQTLRKQLKKEVMPDNVHQLANSTNGTAVNVQTPQLATNEIDRSNVSHPQISNVVVDGARPPKNFKDSIVTKPGSDAPQPMYVNNTDKNENKRLRGFFRKATRLIERTTTINPANDDNKVLIGGMAINLR
ncbi:MAG TPA: hypothetical protein VGI82_10670 [Chitinophagaceae bacterium]